MPREGDGSSRHAPTNRAASLALTVIAAVLLLIGDLAIYADRELFDSKRFADDAVSALEDPAVRDAAARRVARAITREVNPDLVAFEALIEPVAAGVIGSPPFRSALRQGLRQAHAIALGEGEGTAAVTVANFGTVAIGALRQLSPKLAADIPTGLDTTLLHLGEAGASRDATRIAEAVSQAALVFPLAALLLFAAAITLAPDRRAALTRAGVAVAIVGILVVVGFVAARALVAGQAQNQLDADALRGLWDALLGELRDWNLALAALGAVVAGAGAAVLRPIDAAAPLRRFAAAAAATPSSPLWRAVRATGFLAAGLLMVLEPEFVLRALTVVAGLLLISFGVGELIRLTIPAAPERAESVRTDRRRLAAALLIGAGCAAVIVVAALSLIGGGDSKARTARAPAGTCNGSAELCDRPLNEAVFPGTHNSMAAADYRGFLFPMHDRRIPRQLDDGVRALLIDVYSGIPGRRVYTDFSQIPNKLIDQAREQLGPAFVKAGDRIRSDIARPKGSDEPELYMCHGFCELGAVPLAETLSRIDSFLEANPQEILMIVIEDYVKPQDVVDAFERSGLADRAYPGELGPGFPTLGELAESGKQLVVMAENNAGVAPWYRQAFDLFQETPFDVSAPAEMSCVRNRGARSNPLFLLNNWINTDPAAKPSNAAKVNAKGFLLNRARSCARRRDLVPNVIAVDFYREGDLTGVADSLNRDGG